MELRKIYTFEAAHWLPNVPEEHKCRRKHGHSYKVVLSVKGRIDSNTGWIMDFSDVSAAWKDLEKQLDHRMLNEIEDLENPTAEMLCWWIFDRLATGAIVGLGRVEVWETATSMAALDSTEWDPWASKKLHGTAAVTT